MQGFILKGAVMILMKGTFLLYTIAIKYFVSNLLYMYCNGGVHHLIRFLTSFSKNGSVLTS